MADLRILIAEPLDFSPAAQAILERAGTVELVAQSGRELARAFQEYDVVWIRLGHRIDAATLGDTPRCRWLAVPATGLNHVDLEACRARGVRVVSLRGETDFLKQLRATAELAVGLLLSLVRHLPWAMGSVLEGEWNRDRFSGVELFEKQAGLVGVGRLGTITAGYLSALGMKVVGYDPRPDFPEGVERCGELHALLASSDVVSLHAISDPSTRHLIGRAELRAMKPSAVLINTARGELVDEAALLEALRQGWIAGAALDVLTAEPNVPHDHPLIEHARTHDNLLIVPHLGGRTRDSLEKAERYLAQRLVELLNAGAAR